MSIVTLLYQKLTSLCQNSIAFDLYQFLVRIQNNGTICGNRLMILANFHDEPTSLHHDSILSNFSLFRSLIFPLSKHKSIPHTCHRSSSNYYGSDKATHLTTAYNTNATTIAKTTSIDIVR